MAKQDDWARITLRLPPDVYEQLMAAVANSPVSLNAEIVSRLQASLDAPTKADDQGAPNHFEQYAAAIASSAAQQAVEGATMMLMGHFGALVGNQKRMAAWQAGRSHFEAGGDRDENPHSAGSASAVDWQAGFTYAGMLKDQNSDLIPSEPELVRKPRKGSRASKAASQG